MITFDLFSALIDSRTGASRGLAGIAAEQEEPDKRDKEGPHARQASPPASTPR